MTVHLYNVSQKHAATFSVIVFLPRDAMQARPILSCGVCVCVCVYVGVCVCLCVFRVHTFCQKE